MRLFFEDSLLLYSLLKDYRKGTYRNISAKSILIFLITLLYLISPIDIINDFIPVIGVIDDLTLIGIGLYFLEKDLYKYKAWKEKITPSGR